MAFLPAIGTAISAISGVLGGIGAAGQARYQAQVAENNSKIAAQNAQLASDTAQASQLSQDQQTAALVGEQESIQGASGLSVNGASQLRTRRSAMVLGRQDANNIREEGNRNIQNFLQQSENFSAEAGAQRANATGSLLGGFLSGASSLISGANSIRSPGKFGSVSTGGVASTTTPIPTARPTISTRIPYDYRRSTL